MVRAGAEGEPWGHADAKPGCWGSALQGQAPRSSEHVHGKCGFRERSHRVWRPHTNHVSRSVRKWWPGTGSQAAVDSQREREPQVPMGQEPSWAGLSQGPCPHLAHGSSVACGLLQRRTLPIRCQGTGARWTPSSTFSSLLCSEWAQGQARSHGDRT